MILSVVVRGDRGTHERTGLVEAAGRTLRALRRHDEGVRVGGHVVAVALLLLDFLLRRQVLVVVLEMVRLEGLAERQLLRMSDAWATEKNKRHFSEIHCSVWLCE